MLLSPPSFAEGEQRGTNGRSVRLGLSVAWPAPPLEPPLDVVFDFDGEDGAAPASGLRLLCPADNLLELRLGKG